MLDRLVQANDWTGRRPCSIYSPAVVNLATISEGRYIAVSILSRLSLVFEICISYRERRQGSHPSVHAGRKVRAITKAFNYIAASRQPGIRPRLGTRLPWGRRCLLIYSTHAIAMLLAT